MSEVSKQIKGDLIKLALNGEFDVIVHGCNCFCIMGAGIAKSIKQVFPQAYAADMKTVKGGKSKLGSYSSSAIVIDDKEFTVINAYTQYHWRGTGNKADYKAIRSVFSLIKKNYAGMRIGYPLIGAGLAGGDWNVISGIIKTELTGEDHTLVLFNPNNE